MPITDETIQTTRMVPIVGKVADVFQPTTTYKHLERHWSLIDDLLAGTARMRERGEVWLPREQGEAPLDFKKRLQRSFLFNALKDTVEKIVSKPFSQPVQVTPDEMGSEQLDLIADDVDGAGMDLTGFAAELFGDLVSHGKAHIWVDYPKVGEEGVSLAQQRKDKIRPLWSRVRPHDLIGWRHVKEGGIERLTQVRIRDDRVVPDGEYGERVEESVWVYSQEFDGAEVFYEKWTVNDHGQSMMVESGTMTVTRIPLVTIYAKREEYMISYPPLNELAEMNLAHWQSSSDQRNFLRFARIGMISMTGVSQDEMDMPTVIAPNAVLKSVNPDAKFGYVEHSGKALEAGERDLEHLEEYMQVLGQQPFTDKAAMSTATGVVSKESKHETSVQRWIRSLENGIMEAYLLSGEWIDFELPEDFGINVFSDFNITSRDPKDADFLLKSRAQGDITRERFLLEAKRRGIFADDLDIEAEVAAADDDEKAKMSQMGGPDDPFGGVNTNNPFGGKPEEDDAEDDADEE